ncbi:hypothetical protein [Nocardioides panacisoli]|uniref:CsbD family protein n=1 Tax=Nocardioides panacisoli TaxID=627624 RepID=A0ABP7ISC7_9ACTN
MSDREGPDHLTKGEIAKDAVEATAQAAATAVGEVATIITRAIGDIAGAVGGFATEVFEIRDASRRASQEHLSAVDADADGAESD